MEGSSEGDGDQRLRPVSLVARVLLSGVGLVVLVLLSHLIG